ncbi:MAG: hypothetical protein M1813_001583 [Trichoglossum hirsutum]|nr:MAG: hypothetical protein M1813_001583 [Trichoglossum hirsutum]
MENAIQALYCEALKPTDSSMEEQFRAKGVDKHRAKGDSSNTALLEATTANNTDSTPLLPRKEIEFDRPDNVNRTELSWAASGGWTEVVPSSLELGAEPDRKDVSERTALSYAAEKGAEGIVRLLVDNGVYPNSEDDSRRTPLSYAAEQGNEIVVQQLMADERIALNSRGEDGRTLLSLAAGNGHEAAVRLLIAKGADVNARNKDGRTALHQAANSGHEATVRLLVGKGADINTKDSGGRTALLQAAESGHELIVRLLVEKGADTKSTLLWAAEYGQKATVQLLVEKGADINGRDDHGNTSLLWAAKRERDRQRALVQFDYMKAEDNELELREGEYISDIEMPDSDWWQGQNSRGEVGLFPANYVELIEIEHEAMVQLLVEKGADVNVKDCHGNTALLWAAKCGHEAMVRLLVEKGANTKSTLFWAAEYGQEATVQLLVDKGADINARDDHGNTVLLWVAKQDGQRALVQYGYTKAEDNELELREGEYINDIEMPDSGWWQGQNSRGEVGLFPANYVELAEVGHEAMVRLLVEKGADVNAKDGHGNTALLWAAKCGHEATVRLLLEKEADTEVALPWAAECGYEAILVEMGVNINTKDDGGRTALLQAAKGGHEAIVRLLVERGADVNVEDDYGNTALLWAAKCGHESTVQLLLEKGADTKVALL